MHEPRHDLAHLVCKLQDAFVAWIRHPPMLLTPNCRSQPLSHGILELKPLDHLHVRRARIGNRRPGPVYVEPSLGQRATQAFVALACGDDDMWLTVHEAASLIGADLADGQGRDVGSG